MEFDEAEERFYRTKVYILNFLNFYIPLFLGAMVKLNLLGLRSKLNRYYGGKL